MFIIVPCQQDLYRHVCSLRRFVVPLLRIYDTPQQSTGSLPSSYFSTKCFPPSVRTVPGTKINNSTAN